MITIVLNKVNHALSNADFGKLLLRLTVVGLMLFLGLHNSWGSYSPRRTVASFYDDCGLASGGGRGNMNA